MISARFLRKFSTGAILAANDFANQFSLNDFANQSSFTTRESAYGRSPEPAAPPMSTRPRRAEPCFEIGKTAACVGLRSTPDCRARSALLHLAYSCIPPCGTGDTRDTRSDRTYQDAQRHLVILGLRPTRSQM